MEFSVINPILYTFGIILTSSSILIPYCIFPAHDIVKFPKYWYEILYHGFLFSLIEIMFWTFIAGTFLNLRYLKNVKTLSIVCICGNVSTILFYISSYFAWTWVFNYNYPIPFFGYTISFFHRTFSCVSICLVIHKKWRFEEGIEGG